MHHASFRTVLGVVVVAAGLLLSGCGGGSQTLPKDPFAYNASRPLLVQVARVVARRPDEVRSLTYAAADGTRVPALFAIPQQGQEAGCLMYQPGAGAPKETAAAIWPGAARLGLAVFTIDPRYTGARAGGRVTLSRELGTAQGLISFLRNDVIDLRRGLDYLESQARCHHKVGYLGISEGASLGALLAGDDRRIQAAVLCSIGATWRSRLFYSPIVLQELTHDPAAARSAVAELAPLDQARWIAKISPRPVMIVDGLSDPIIPPVDALNLAAAARDPKVLVLHLGGHDPFAGPGGAAVAAQVATFLRKNLVNTGSRP